jgi:hypothetical protein
MRKMDAATILIDNHIALMLCFYILQELGAKLKFSV